MKSLRQLAEEVIFESGAKGLKNLDTVAQYVIKETLDKYTGMVKYPELITTQLSSLTAGATVAVSLPTNLQHFDGSSVAFLLGGSEEPEDVTYLQKYLNSRPLGSTGEVKYFQLNGAYLTIYPADQITSSDWVTFQYWRTGSSLLDDPDTVIKPDLLLETIKQEATAKLGMTLGNKNARDYLGLAKDARIAHFGAVDLPPM